MAKPNIDENKLKALESAMAQIERNYGKGAVMKLGDNTHLNVETVPSGSLSLDIALGVGGVPKGRVVEVYATGVRRKDYSSTSYGGRGTKKRRHCRIYRCRACP